jgi:hypothetical protein
LQPITLPIGGTYAGGDLTVLCPPPQPAQTSAAPATAIKEDQTFKDWRLVAAGLVAD